MEHVTDDLVVVVFYYVEMGPSYRIMVQHYASGHEVLFVLPDVFAPHDVFLRMAKATYGVHIARKMHISNCFSH